MTEPHKMSLEELKKNSSYDPTEEGKLLKVSKSSFMTYSKCPRKFYWEKIALKDLRMPANEYMIHGTAVHNNLETIYDNWEGQSTLAPLIPEEQASRSDSNLVFLEECRIELWGVENFKPDEYEEYRAVWDEEHQCVLVGLIDAVLVMPDGSLCIYELKTGQLSNNKLTNTRRELCYYERMLRLMGETRPITHFAYICPDATNNKLVAELCGWKREEDGKPDEMRVHRHKGGWLDSNTKKQVAVGRYNTGILIIEKINRKSINGFEEAFSDAVEGIKNGKWDMNWDDFFCPQWCEFSMSCESEMNGVDNLW